MFDNNMDLLPPLKNNLKNLNKKYEAELTYIDNSWYETNPTQQVKYADDEYDDNKLEKAPRDSLKYKIKRASTASSNGKLLQLLSEDQSSHRTSLRSQFTIQQRMSFDIEQTGQKRSSLLINAATDLKSYQLRRQQSQFIGLGGGLGGILIKEDDMDGNFSDIIMEDCQSETSEVSIKMDQIQQDQNDDEPIPELQRSSKRKKNKKKKDRSKFKTEMCRNWSITGVCNYTKKCQFAHGKHELESHINPDTNNKYRSKKCKTFNLYDTCPYGQRCQFMHESRNMEQIRSEYIYQKIVNNPQVDWLQSNFDTGHMNPLDDYISLKQRAPRCSTMRQISLRRSKSQDIYNSIFHSVRSKSSDKKLLQDWVNDVRIGLLVNILSSSSEESTSQANYIYNDQNLINFIFD